MTVNFNVARSVIVTLFVGLVASGCQSSQVVGSASSTHLASTHVASTHVESAASTQRASLQAAAKERSKRAEARKKARKAAAEKRKADREARKAKRAERLAAFRERQRGGKSSASSSHAASMSRGAQKPVKAKQTTRRGVPYEELIIKYARAEGVPVALALAVVRVESNYRANARGRAGEVGLMQIKPSTARGMGYRGSVKALYNPETNIRWGMKYLGKAHRLGGGSTCGTILKYNAGHGAKRMNRISANYCRKVKRYLA